VDDQAGSGIEEPVPHGCAHVSEPDQADELTLVAHCAV
jgi:hypothetical protein